MGNIDWPKIVPHLFSFKKNIPITLETYLLDCTRSKYEGMFSTENFEAEFFKKAYEAALAIESYCDH